MIGSSIPQISPLSPFLKQVRVVGKKFDVLAEEAKNRKEEWMWDKVIPARDITLIAAFMKKGKTTMLTGLVQGLLKTGVFCGREVKNGRKVFYMAPEEGHTLVKRFIQMGFDGPEPGVTIVPRADPMWDELVKWYRMGYWGEVVKDLKKQGYDTIVMDGLHTMLGMFEATPKEDNETVTAFMSKFVLPFGNDFTVICSLHTKKAGGDPRMHTPPEEMIRGASAWLAHPGQIIVMDHDRKVDVKKLTIFGRYEDTDDGIVLRYEAKKRTYVAFTEEEMAEEADAATKIKADIERKQIEQIIMFEIGQQGQASMQHLYGRVSKSKAKVKAVVGELVASGELESVDVKLASGRQGKEFKVPVKVNPLVSPKVGDVDFDSLDETGGEVGEEIEA